MTEQEAIEYIENHGYISDDVKDMAIKALEKQHNNGWITVDERLPEDGVRVLTCDNYKNVHVMRHYNFYEYPFCIGPEHERYYMPKAWMPLPEPYKESEE